MGPSIDSTRIPFHIAIIMDGNGRWAMARSLPRAAGHRAGVEAARRTLEAARDLGVGVLTLYAFSTENWRRPPEEVSMLMQLLAQSLRDEADDLVRRGVQLRVSGDLESLDPAVRAEVEQVIGLTGGNRALILNVAYNYGGRAEILTAARRLAREAAAGRLVADAITDQQFEAYLYTAGLPDPDLLIRTGGEQRVSNFLLWQMAYAELYFCDVYWPDFDRTHLSQAIVDYQQRRRRFGGIEES